MEAGEEVDEAIGPDREHHREADRRVHRVAPADPVPEAEHVVGVDAELSDPLGVGRDGDEVLGDRLSAPSLSSAHFRAVWALVIVSSVVKVFEETMKSVSSGSRSRVFSAKSVPSTLETKRKVMSRFDSGGAPRRPSPARGPSRRCRC